MANGDIFRKIAGVWTKVGNIAGPPGSGGGGSTTSTLHSESLTDGKGNFIFAGGDIVTVIQIPEGLPI